MNNDSGSATAETAVALPALVFVLGLCVWALSVVSATLRCADAARAAARVAARNEPAAAVTAAARRAAGRPVTTEVRPDGDLVTVRVAIRVAPGGGLLARLVPAVTVRQDSTARVEPEPDAP
jgi:Flp pilus assembly protein TadG